MLSAFFTLMPFHGNTTYAITETGAQEASLPQIVTGSNAPVTAKKAALALPLEASHSWWARVQDDIRASEYKMSWQNRTRLPSETAAYQAPNRAHNLRTYFTADGIRVVPRTSVKTDWMWGLTLAGYGLEGDEQPVGPEAPSASGNRIEYNRSGLKEWYINDERGLEQGFTLHAPPASRLPSPSPWVVLEMILSGSLNATHNTATGTIEFATISGETVLHYGQLHALDAGGCRLPATFDLAGNQIIIRVDTTHAVYPVTIDPLATSPYWTAESNMANAEFGYSVSTAGDVDGDGCDDVIVSAPWYDMGTPNQGRVSVYYGSLYGLWDSPFWTIQGVSGWSVATAGDVNDDGYADVIIGASNRVYVYYGSEDGLGPGGTGDDADWTAESGQSSFFGCSVGTAGDVNGDGYADIIIGDPYYSNGEYFEGAAIVYHGSSTGLGAPGTPQNADWIIEGGQAYALFGYSVGTAGDVNADAYADVIIGAPDYNTSGWRKGKVFVYHGSADGLNTSPAWTAAPLGLVEGDFGFAVGTAGDVNGDGYFDVIVGEPFEENTSREGRAFVYHGSSTGLDLNGLRPVGTEGNADWSAQTGGVEGRFGWSVGTAGDVDGDRYADVIIGAPYWSNGYFRYGRAYMYRGSAVGIGPDYAWYALSDTANADFGASVNTAGDINGDGYADVIIGAPGYTNGEFGEGRAFVYWGSRFVPPVVSSRNAGAVTTSEATLNGRLDGLGSASSVQVFFEWGSATVGEVSATYGTGSNPEALTFDGQNIWVANRGSGNVMKFRAADGELLGTYPVGTGPQALAFDGANIWVAHSWYENNSVRKLRASDGMLLGTYPVGTYNYDLVYDGTHIWVTNGSEDSVMKLRPSDGKIIGTYPVGDYPMALAFDGTYIWVANWQGDSVTRLRANSGALVATYNVGDGPTDLLFDGTHIWVANNRDHTLMKLDAYSGDRVATYDYVYGPNSLAFDGVHIWVANYDSVMKLRAADGKLLGTYTAGEAPNALAFDATDIWVANNYSANVMKLKATPYEHKTPTQTRTGAGLFSAGINGLNPETIYHFRARAVGDGNGYGADMTFTFTPGPPVVASTSATDVTADSAALNGNLYYLGDVSAVDVSFEWGLDTGYGNETPPQRLTGTGPFSAGIVDLDPGATYHFRAKAVGNGTGYGDDMSFVAQVNEVWIDDDYTAGGYNDGHNWGIDAFATIQGGIDIVASPGTVNVAPGIYNETITLRSGVKVLGSGAGNDPAVHAIIDGSGLFETVVRAENVDSSAQLDGFKITNGYGWMLGGGGMYNYQSSPTVTNCIFSGNEAEESGGGMYNLNSSPIVINCLFSGNQSWQHGAGMYNAQSPATVINCTFSGNTASGSGGGMFNASSTATVTNSVFWENTAYQGNEVFNVSSFPAVTYCDIQLPSGTYEGTGNINADPLFIDPANGNFHLQSGSPCIDAGDNTAVPPGVTSDIAGGTRFFDDPDTDDTGSGVPPIVDIGVDEYLPAGLECQGDFEPADGDVDGADLEHLAAGYGTVFNEDDLTAFAVEFGRSDCMH